MKKFIVIGIGTNVGKTIISAILCEAMNAAYWKPIQAGELESSDSIMVKKLTANKVEVLPEVYRLKHPESPHSSARKDGISIEFDKLALPSYNGNLIIETAGGLMVPLNDEGLLNLHLVKEWQLPVIVVSRHYLGSINHSLLTASALAENGIKTEGVIFIGNNPESEKIIEKVSGWKHIATVPETNKVDPDFIKEQADILSLKMTN